MELDRKDMIEIVREIAENTQEIMNEREGYSDMLMETERAEAAAKGIKELLKSYWANLKAGDSAAMHACAVELERQATLSATAFAKLAAVAKLSAEVDD